MEKNPDFSEFQNGHRSTAHYEEMGIQAPLKEQRVFTASTIQNNLEWGTWGNFNFVLPSTF